MDSSPIEDPPTIEVSTAALSFDQVEIDDTASGSILVSNKGDSTLTIDGVTVSEPFSSPFSIHLDLAPGASTSIGVVFDPDGYDRAEQQLVISNNDPVASNLTVTLVGTVDPDSDDDGYVAIEAGGSDCDDSRADVHPGASDEWYDGVDSDCRGNNDFDQDRDGFEKGEDCQDTDPDTYPGAPDEWYDGYDTDCGGEEDYDQDGDGSNHPLGGGNDCDDEDPLVLPGANEVLNGVDDDCNGTVDRSVDPEVTFATLTGDAGDAFGASVTIGKLYSDTTQDLVVGIPDASGGGAVAIYDGGSLPLSGGTADATALLTNGGSSFGSSVLVLQDYLSGDGVLAVGDDGANEVVLLDAEAAFAGTLDVVFTLQGHGGRTVGSSLSEADLDDDGIAELLVAEAGASSSGLAVVSGATAAAGGTLALSDVDARYDLSGGGGTALSGPGDFNDDGYDDLLFCDPTLGSGGGAWVVWGGADYQTVGAVPVTSAGTEVVAGDAGDDAGLACAVGHSAYGPDDLWVWFGDDHRALRFAGDVGLDAASYGAGDAVRSVAFDLGSSTASSMSSIGDWSGDGYSEIAVGIEIGNGSVWVLDSGVTGSSNATDAGLATLSTIGSSGDFSAFGSVPQSQDGDVTAVGTYNSDLVVADPGYADGAGQVLVYGNPNE